VGNTLTVKKIQWGKFSGRVWFYWDFDSKNENESIEILWKLYMAMRFLHN